MHNTKIRFFINFFNHKFQRYAKNIAFALIASLLLFSCNNAPEWNYPIKTFVKEGFAKADSTDVNYAEQVTVGKIKYVPSGTTIHATAKIRNPQKIAFDAELTLSNAVHSAFFVNAIKPFKIKTASGEIVTFEFELKDTADFSSFFAKGADIPVVLKLRKAGTPVEFGKTEFTIHCNTRPLAPTGISSASDNFTINLPTQAIHQDIVLLECVVSAGGTQIKRNIPVASGQTSKTVSVKDFAKGVVVPLKNANGLRSISVTTIDKAGLRSATTTNANGNHTYKSDKALQLSIRSGTDTSLTNISFTNSPPSSNTYVGSVEVFVSDAVLKVMSIGDGATVKCAGVSQVVGTETNVHFDVQDEKVYIYTVTAEDETVFSYKVTVKRIATVAINSATDTWKTLKEAVDGIADGGVITINGEIKATNATDNSGEIEINKNITIKRAVGATSAILNANCNHSGTVPSDAPTNSQRIFKVADGKTLTLDNLKIKGGRGDVTGDGGGAIYAEGNLTMTECTVTGNKTEYGNGGGIYAAGDLNMTDCIVEQNTVDDGTAAGGGIYIYVTGTHIMKDCTVDHNTAKYNDGGGIYAAGNLTMEGCTFAYNQAKSNGKGGAVYATATLTMKDCTVTNNETVNGNGGGIYATSTLSMEGGTVINNKTTHGDGGGIYTTGTFTMKDCTLTGNEAVNNKIGGGLYVNGTSFTMKGTSCVTPSTDNAKGKNDVYLASDKMITVEDELTPAGGIAARITVLHNEYLPTTQVLTGSKVNTEYTKFSVTPKGSEKWSVNEQGKLGLMEAAIDAVASPADAWKKFKEAVEFAVDGAVITVKGEIKATNATDNSGEIVIDKNLTIKKAGGASTAVLNANKDTGGKAKHRIFKVEAGKKLTLENLTLKGGKGIAGNIGGGAITVTGSGSKAEIEDCIIEDCEANKGGAIGCDKNTTVNLTNTTVQNCKATDTTGGAISARGATVTLTNCTLKGNEAQSIGGAIYAVKFNDTGSNVTVTGGTIGGTNAADANKATGTSSGEGRGGGIYVSNGCTLNLQNNVQLIGNTAAKHGGGVYAIGATVNITNCTLKGNEAQRGGAVCAEKLLNTASTVTVTGGTIGGTNAADANKATGSDGQGGAIYVGAGCILTMQDNAQLTGNTATKSGGGVTVFGGEFTMEGGVIQGNTVTGTSTVQNSGHGGGVEIVAAVMNMKGGEIKSNTAQNGGGGVSIALSGASNSVLNMSGGTISGNTLTNTAGTGKGVEFFTGSTTHSGTTYYTIMKMSGSAKVDTNNDVYVNDSRMITVDGALTGTAPAARITPKTYAAGRQVLDGSAVGTEYAKFTVTPKDSEKWIVAPNGYLQCPKVTLRVQSPGNTIKVKAVTSDSSAVTVTGANTSTIGGNGTETTLISIGTTITLNGYITELDCSGTFGVKNNITKLEFDGCALLQKLKCELCLLTTLDVSSLTALKELECFANELTGLNLSGLTALKELNCSSNKLTNLNVSGLTRLQKLECFANELTGLNLSGLTALKELNCSINKFTSLNISGLTALQNLQCNSCQQLTSLNISGCNSLTAVSCIANKLESLDVSGLTGLQELYCTNNKLTSIQMNNNTNLKVLECSINNLTQDAFKWIFIYLPMREPSDKGVCVLYSQKPSDNEGNNMTFTSLPAYTAAKDRNWNMAYIDSSGTQQPIP